MHEFFLRYLINSFLVYLSIFPVFADEAILGMWSATIRTKGGLGSQWVFSENSVVNFTFGALVDFKYKIEGSEIQITPIDTDDSPSEEVTSTEFSIDGDIFTESSNLWDKKLVMRRQSKAFKEISPIVGEWSYKFPINNKPETVIKRFTRNGTGQLSFPMQSAGGKFKTSNGILTVLMADQPQRTYHYKLENNHLTLTDDENGKQTKFKKFEY